jgi:hypothetical protein
MYRSNYESQCKVLVLGQFRVSNSICFQCLAVLVNAQVGPHKDSDWSSNYVSLAALRKGIIGARALIASLRSTYITLPASPVPISRSWLEIAYKKKHCGRRNTTKSYSQISAVLHSTRGLC